MWSGFLDLILIPVQFNSIRPPGSRSGLVLKRDVIDLQIVRTAQIDISKKKKADSLSASLFFPALSFRAALDYLKARNKF